MAYLLKVLIKALCVFSVLALLNTLYVYKQNRVLTQPRVTYLHSNQTKFIAMYPHDPRSIRLGNQIFQFASILGIAEMNGLVAVIACDHYLKGFFEITVPCVNKSEIKVGKGKKNWSREKGGGIYDQTVETMGFTESVVINGYLESWKYFNKSKDTIKRQIRFKQHILDMAHQEIDRVIKAMTPPIGHPYVKIAVHVRRGEISNKTPASGNCPAPVEYFNRSMDSMRSKYKHQNIVFIVCSDGMDWAKRNVKGEDVVYASTGNVAADLAVLSLCDAVILASSTYGWWGAWLSGGPVIYYKNYPYPGSPYARKYHYEDFYPPWWTGM